MHVRRVSKKASGFTLVEILIVVVILGILAAIVVPQFTTAADEARGGNVATQVSTLQQQIELYRAREGAYPTVEELNQASADGENDHWGLLLDGNYIKEEAVNPFNNSSEVGAPGDEDVGWWYDEATGNLYAYGDEDAPPGGG
ncbi:MAG: prepilin-type N-terminal cleavage/methylation domain-containing protein [Phycisphaerales bacterium]|jgi:general secretion pathway protein G|nr:prepilin-type N-terminal cleavage/methylation domain-containing protein [Phycisphaerales bacterium]